MAVADQELQEGEPPENCAPSQAKVSTDSARKPRQKRPNYHEIHAKPLPLEVYPLPTFIPHNPISCMKIAISLLAHVLRVSTSHTITHQAYFSSETQSIHVTDPTSIRALWEHGFFGKGSLSRSEPQWLVTEQRRRGVDASKTSAEVTRSRREERKQFKLERAKAQREAIEQQLRQEGKLDAEASLDELVEDGQVSESPRGTLYTPDAGDIITVKDDSIVSAVSESLANKSLSWDRTGDDADANDDQEAEVHDLEHLQLTLEEAFFLTYGLGALNVIKDGDLEDVGNQNTKTYPAWYLMRLYCAHASSPADESKIAHLRMAYHMREGLNQAYPAISCMPSIEPDNLFMLKYVVYHHFRSLGWVVRPGIKFAVDYLLYLRGPAFTHAEFAIMIVPSYSHLHWTKGVECITNKKQKDWWWLHRINRVQTQVMKTLLLVYVEVPPPWDQEYRDAGFRLDVGAILKKYTVREFVVKRWSPSRNRD